MDLRPPAQGETNFRISFRDGDRCCWCRSALTTEMGSARFLSYVYCVARLDGDQVVWSGTSCRLRNVVYRNCSAYAANYHHYSFLAFAVVAGKIVPLTRNIT